jgi:hypothetical protein
MAGSLVAFKRHRPSSVKYFGKHENMHMFVVKVIFYITYASAQLLFESFARKRLFKETNELRIFSKFCRRLLRREIAARELEMDQNQARWEGAAA